MMNFYIALVGLSSRDRVGATKKMDRKDQKNIIINNKTKIRSIKVEKIEERVIEVYYAYTHLDLIYNLNKNALTYTNQMLLDVVYNNKFIFCK